MKIHDNKCNCTCLNNTALQNKKKLAGEWNISADSTSLELTDTQMKPRFAPLAQIFPQNQFFLGHL